MARPRRATRNRRSTTAIVVALVVVLALIGAGVGLALYVRSSWLEMTAVDRCLITTSSSEASLSPDQAHYASIIAGISVQRGMPERAATVAIATAYQESDIDNIDYGDRDSLGLFQQRPSQGWGTAEEIMDPVYATNAFYDALEEVDGWEDLEITEAAQAVQRSAYPDAYAQHEDNARAVAAAFTGQTQRSVTCLDRVDVTGDADALAELLTTIYGSQISAEATSTGVTVTTEDDSLAWAVAHTMVANHARYGMSRVEVGQSAWEPADLEVGAWTDSDAVTGVIATAAE